MKRVMLFVLVLVAFVNSRLAAQDDFGSGGGGRTGMPSFFNVAKPGDVTIQVNMWGYVDKPGRYEVPVGTDIIELLSYAGGPLRNSKLDAVRVYKGIRPNGTNTTEVIVDVEKILDNKASVPVLENGDTVYLDYEFIVPLREFVNIISSTLTVTLALLTMLNRI